MIGVSNLMYQAGVQDIPFMLHTKHQHRTIRFTATLKTSAMKRFDKYQKSLCIVEKDNTTYVKSYETLVAKVEGDELVVFCWWSQTTSKHINYAAKQLGLKINR